MNVNKPECIVCRRRMYRRGYCAFCKVLMKRLNALHGGQDRPAYQALKRGRVEAYRTNVAEGGRIFEEVRA